MYNIHWIAQHLGAEAIFGQPPQGAVRFLSIDTRTVRQPAQTLFFALHGPQRDGHAFLGKAYHLGLRLFVVSEKIETTNFPEATFFFVKNTQAALQKLAAAHRQTFDFPLIGITGSNGKTIVKEWLFHLLEKNFDIVRSPGSYNSQIGVPLSVWEMSAQHNLGIFEAGISQPGEMGNLAAIIQANIGVFTTIGTAHESGFTSQKEKINEKIQLFKSCTALVYCKDHAFIHEAILDWEKEKSGRKRLFWTKTADAQADLSEIAIENPKNGLVRIKAKDKTGKTNSIRIPFTDAASIENALHCWVLSRFLGLPQATISRRMRHLPAIQMRLEIKAGIHQCTLLNDSYNNDLTSLNMLLAQAAKQAQEQKLTLILSDILQDRSPALYKEVARLLGEFSFGRIIGIGSEITALKKHLKTETEGLFFKNTDDFLANLHSVAFQNELIVIKGARPFSFERIVRRLEQKVHRTVLEVNLSALAHNLNVYRRCLKPDTKMLAMVKASGYGSGSVQVARLMEYQGVDYLGVAYADEGVRLREEGIKLPILVLNTDASGFDVLARYDLEPEIYSIGHLNSILDFCKKNRQKLRVHLKLETGMNRLGFDDKDLPKLLETIAENQKNLETASVFSHLAGSDSARFDSFTQKQAERFESLSQSILAILPYPALRHLVNTAGIVRHPDFHYDMVRLGIGVYGVEAGETPEALHTVNTLKATISQIRTVEIGATIGYNRAGQPARRSRIATVSIGYADGLLRLAGNGRYALWISGQLAPTIGNICMDMCMADVTEIPSAQEGDEVEVFGPHLPVEALAKALQTIPYEVFTNISERVTRLYVEG